MKLLRIELKYWLSIVCIGTFLMGISHELRIARFDITRDQLGYELIVKMDIENALYVLENECSSIDLKNYGQINEMMLDYIKEHFSLNMDGEFTPYELNCVEYDQDFVTLSGYLLTTKKDFKKMSVRNTCMIESIPKHSNIIHINAKGKTRAFRLHKDRPTTVIEY